MKKGQLKYTAEELEKKINEYFHYIDNTPLYKYDVVKTGNNAGQELPIKVNQPYTIQGLIVYLDIHLQTWYNWMDVSNADPQIFDIATRANNIIRNNQISGAASGLFNPLVVSRLQGLTDTNLAFSVNLNAEKKSIEEVQAIIQTLENIRNKNKE